MNYLDLTNEAIRESGATLELLDSTEFLSPSEPMHQRFKGWVRRAWKEIQISRERWSFMQKRGYGIIYPRIFVRNGNLAAEPAVGALFQGNLNGSTFRVVNVETLSGDWTLGTAEAYIDIEDIEGEFGLGETFDQLSPAASEVFKLVGRGRYNFTDWASDFDDIDYQSVYLGYVDASPAEYMDALDFIEWNIWNNYYEADVGNLSKPAQFTQTPDNLFDFYPAPEKAYRLYFNYERKPQILENHDDIPELPEEFQEIILWLAVMHYAEYDQNVALQRRAAKEYQHYKTRLENKCLPKIGWAPNPYNHG